MGFWNTIKKWFFVPKRNFPDSRHPDIYPLDVDEITKELKLEEEARRFGERGLPPSNATTLDGTEEKIVLKIGKIRQDYVEWGSLRLKVLTEALAKLDVTQAVNQALQADKEFERKANVLLAESASFTDNLAETAKRSQHELEAFREKHNLRRAANILRSTQIALRYLVLIFLIITEGVVNASFFSQGMTSGLIGGFLVAAIFAALNLIVAFCWGRFGLPFAFHSNALQKISGYLAIAGALFCMITISLMIAHYRNALIAEAIDPARMGWEALSTNPFGLNDILSWGLFAVSFAFAIFALFDGLSFDDRYPGYGSITRRAAKARAGYVEEINGLRDKLEELKNEHLSALREQLDQAQTFVAQRDSLILDKISAESRLGNALDNASNCMAALLAMYRRCNVSHRNGVPHPAYFDRPVQLENLVLPNFSTEGDEAEKARQQLMVETLLSQLECLRANIQASFTKSHDRLTPLDAHFEYELKTV